MKVKHNMKRIEYLLSLYKMTTEELLLQMNMGLKKHIQLNDLFGEEIEINHLKRIDKIFNKGLHYYLDENVPVDSNDYFFDRVSRLSGDTHLSKLAIYTRLLFNGQISQADYNQVRIGLEKNFRLKQEEKARQKENDKMLGVKSKGAAPKPINSPLLISTVQIAYYEGIMNESDVCKTLNISPEKLELFIQ